MLDYIKKSILKWLIIALVCILLVIVEVHFDLKIPEIMSDITNNIQNNKNDLDKILKSGYKMLLYTFGSIISVFIASVLVARVASELSANLRMVLFKKTQMFSLREINKFSVPSLITRTTNDVVHIENVIVTGTLVFFKAPVVFIMTLRKINVKSREWSFTTFAAIFLIVLICTIALLLVYKKFVSLQKLTDDLNLVSRENYNGIYTIRAYNYEKYRYEKFKIKNNNLTLTERFTNVTVAVVNTLITFILNLLPIVIYYIGAYIIDRSNPEKKITVFSDMVVYSTYALQIISAILMIVIVFIMIPRAMVSFKRIAEVIDENISVCEGEKTIDEYAKSLEFKSVYFRYPDARKDALSDLNFSIKSGETLAITGQTGCGKTTLINLIMRFYDINEGEILINGENINRYSINELRSMIGYVPQKAFLFRGTVASNVAYGENIEDTIRVEKACYASCMDDFLNSSPDGQQTRISREGNNLSGGQKQRLSIARALYKEAPILLFDDSFSALDYKTDRAVRDRINIMYKNSIKVIVSQRISTIINADKIIVLENGSISGIGTNESLLKNCDAYRQLVAVQSVGGKR